LIFSVSLRQELSMMPAGQRESSATTPPPRVVPASIRDAYQSYRRELR